jgi:hypothetical protein
MFAVDIGDDPGFPGRSMSDMIAAPHRALSSALAHGFIKASIRPGIDVSCDNMSQQNTDGG